MLMSLSSAAFFAENFAGTVSVLGGAPGTAKAPLTNTAFAGGLAFSGGAFLWAGCHGRLLWGGGRRAARPRLLFGVERAILLQHRTHAHHHKQHDVEAILCSRKARHGITQVRIARTGAGDKLCHGDRSLPQRF